MKPLNIFNEIQMESLTALNYINLKFHQLEEKSQSEPGLKHIILEKHFPECRAESGEVIPVRLGLILIRFGYTFLMNGILGIAG